MQELIRENVLIKGKPTEVVYSKSLTTKNIIMVIPGNPGITSFYDKFVQSLSENLKDSSSYYVVSQAGHCLLTPESFPKKDPVYSLEEQIEHKIDFISEYVPAGSRVTFIGHSIGCYMILEMLKRLSVEPGKKDVTYSDLNFSIDRCYMLFPTIERMKASPRGRALWPVVSWLRVIIVYLVALMTLIPDKLMAILLTKVAGIENESNNQCFVKGLLQLRVPKIFHNMLYLASTELSKVVELDVQTIKDHVDKLFFYFGASDGWCPLNYRDEMVARIPEIETHVCNNEITHSFVFDSSEKMAEILTELLSSQMAGNRENCST